MNKSHFVFLAISTLLLFNSCEEDKPLTKSKPVVEKVVDVPTFSADSAYRFVQEQVDFGPRVPNTPEHSACAEYLTQKMKDFGAEVIVQEANVTAYDGSKLGMKNIIAQFDPENKRRILLFAHWDTRPWADKDSSESKWNTPIDGANDGGSGVAVLMEIARHLKENPTEHGIDIIFFDTEDYGTPEFAERGDGSSWCLGSQYWAKKPHKKNYKAKFGILLDMVGSKTASFPREGTSMYFAPHIVDKVWNNAKKSGNASYFRSDISGHTTDDHLFVNRDLSIPSVCIVEYHGRTTAMGLGNYGLFHHTHNDNMDVIDKNSLQAVGETVMRTIYYE